MPITVGNSLLLSFEGTSKLQWLSFEANLFTEVFPWGLSSEIRQEL